MATMGRAHRPARMLKIPLRKVFGSAALIHKQCVSGRIDSVRLLRCAGVYINPEGVNIQPQGRVRGTHSQHTALC